MVKYLLCLSTGFPMDSVNENISFNTWSQHAALPPTCLYELFERRVTPWKFILQNWSGCKCQVQEMMRDLRGDRSTASLRLVGRSTNWKIAGHYLLKLKMHIPQDPASLFLRETLSQVKNKSHVQECSNSCSQLQTTWKILTLHQWESE